MPDLDVTEVLFDPDFADEFTVIRRVDVVGVDGRSKVTSTTHSYIVGVVTASEPSDLDRRDDAQQSSRTVNVVTVFRLRAATPGFQPDLIILGGLTYTVEKILPFSRFGPGFVEAVATVMSA